MRWPAEEMVLRQRCTCSVPPKPHHGRHAWDPTTVPVVPSVSLICLQPVWFSCKFRHNVCGGRHWLPRRNVMEDYKRRTASKYDVCHPFVWEQKGWRTVSLFIVSLLFFSCPPSVSSCYPISTACAEWFSHVHTIITLHFQPSQSRKYLVYRLLMFIQSTGLHCLGTIARQGPFGRKKETIPNEK